MGKPRERFEMGYSDATITSPAIGKRLASSKGRPDRAAEISAQPAQLYGSRTVIIRIMENGKRTVYEIPLEEWSRLNRDATKTS